MEVARSKGLSQAHDLQVWGSPASQECRASAGRSCPRVAAFSAPKSPAQDLFSNSLFSTTSQDLTAEATSRVEESEEVVKNTILNKMMDVDLEEALSRWQD